MKYYFKLYYNDYLIGYYSSLSYCEKKARKLYLNKGINNFTVYRCCDMQVNKKRIDLTF